MTEAFFLSLQVALYTALYLWIPYILYTFWAFLSPSLFTFEKKKWGWTFTSGILLLYGSVFGAALFFVPTVSHVLFEAAHTGSLVTLDMDPRISSYMQVCFSLYFVAHICTLVPFGLVLCRIKVHRRWLYLICLFGVAFTCPPDPSMQFFCTLCAFVGAELCVVLSTLTQTYANRHASHIEIGRPAAYVSVNVSSMKPLVRAKRSTYIP
jgi:sec-independent protein translocase protein TatC